MRNILEIGPGLNPLHNRDIQRLSLDPEEFYIGVDNDIATKGTSAPLIFEGDMWKEIKKDYGDRVLTVRANAEALPVKDNSQDEVLLLGVLNFNMYESSLKEVNRVLKSGGILKIGVANRLPEKTKEALEPIFSFLKSLGFTEDESQKQEYDYSDVRKMRLKHMKEQGQITEGAYQDEMSREIPMSYLVFTLRKP